MKAPAAPAPGIPPPPPPPPANWKPQKKQMKVNISSSSGNKGILWTGKEKRR